MLRKPERKTTGFHASRYCRCHFQTRLIFEGGVACGFTVGVTPWPMKAQTVTEQVECTLRRRTGAALSVDLSRLLQNWSASSGDASMTLCRSRQNLRRWPPAVQEPDQLTA